MAENNQTQNSGSGISEIVSFVIAIVVFILLFKWLGRGVIWLLNRYAGLLKVR